MALTEAQKASQKQLRSIDGFVSTLKPYRISLSQLFFTWNYRVVHRGMEGSKALTDLCIRSPDLHFFYPYSVNPNLEP
ncbi:hypothetical protein AMTR_s00078p00104640 [Amborella trichopoda]|uniref:Uncharacterized protein n=1 Tax=Amborella trichopoda TaxID=13333 RepID=W1P802_AMBTC|nr:hypothetical protein AMTR_s00078p00104640 [Amborella trichopoda]